MGSREGLTGCEEKLVPHRDSQAQNLCSASGVAVPSPFVSKALTY